MSIPNAETPMAKEIAHCRLMDELGVFIGSNLTNRFFESNIFCVIIFETSCGIIFIRKIYNLMNTLINL
jgi:hypothetical protein